MKGRSWLDVSCISSRPASCHARRINTKTSTHYTSRTAAATCTYAKRGLGPAQE